MVCGLAGYLDVQLDVDVCCGGVMEGNLGSDHHCMTAALL